MARYITKDGDMIDLICFRFYGQANRYTEEVLKANQGLSDLGPILHSGIVIELPDFPELDNESSDLRLWN